MGIGGGAIPPSRLTFQLQADEVGVAEVLQEDAVGGAGLEVEGDVGAGLALEGGEVEVGRRRGERGGVPVVVCGKEERERKKKKSADIGPINSCMYSGYQQ